MEDDEIDLVECIRVIWKRRMLIIVGVLVSMAVGGVVSLRLPETYRAEILLKIGMVLDPTCSDLVPVDSVNNLIQIIIAENKTEAAEDLLKVEEVKGTSMMRVAVEASDQKRTEEMLKRIVSKLIGNHNRLAEESTKSYKDYIKWLEVSIKQEQKAQDEWKVVLGKLYTVGNIGTENYAALSMIQNNNLEMIRILENNMRLSVANIATIEKEILKGKILIANLNGYKTEAIGGMRKMSEKPKRMRIVMLAGAVGLTMSLFSAFFIDYAGRAREVKGNSV